MRPRTTATTLALLLLVVWAPRRTWQQQQHRRYSLGRLGERCAERTFTMRDLEPLRASQERVWEALGESEPWWSVLSSEALAGKRWLDDAERRSFYDSGEIVVARVLRTVDVAFSDRRLALPWTGGGFGEVAVDFGCGVGRLAKALSRRFETVLCVDHSQRHLDVVVATLRRERVLPLKSTTAGSELLGLPRAPQFALSVLALQHVVPQLQVAALEHLCDALAPGGSAFVQLLTAYDASPYVAAGCDPQRAIMEPGMHLHYLPLHEATAHLRRRGCVVLATEPCDDFVAIPGRNSSSHCLVFLRSSSGPSLL